MDYAIIFVAGRQEIVMPQKHFNFVLSSNINTQKNICFNKILLISKKNKLLIGKPYVENCYIIAKIFSKYKSKKMLILRNKPKKNYSKRKGYRKIYYRLYL
jgi:large subunit ribosomal protein L21